jgi:hypothetical protein
MMAPLHWISTGQALVMAGSPEELIKAWAFGGLLAQYRLLLRDGREWRREDNYYTFLQVGGSHHGRSASKPTS